MASPDGGCITSFAVSTVDQADHDARRRMVSTTSTPPSRSARPSTAVSPPPRHRPPSSAIRPPRGGASVRVAGVVAFVMEPRATQYGLPVASSTNFAASTRAS